MRIHLNLNSAADYRLFLRVKELPRFHFAGREAIIPDEYAHLLGVRPPDNGGGLKAIEPLPCLFDYQRDIARLAIRKRKFAVFTEPGLGKTLIDFAFAQHALAATGKRVLIVAPLMVIPQMIEEAARFYGSDLVIEQVRAAGLPRWLTTDGPAIGITNYEAIREGLSRGNLGCLILSESSMLKSMYGKWGQRLITLGRGLDWKLCETGTPAPNDRIEYANHAVFLDQFPTVNSFLARYFINRGQTDNRWELKPHALKPFYRSLSHWCIFLTNPATYGWKDNVGTIPPIHVHIHDVPLTGEQIDLVRSAGGDMFGTPGGITSRARLSQLAKGKFGRNGDSRSVATNKPAFIRDLVASWPDESTIVWCLYDDEQDTIERVLPDAASIRGATKEAVRLQLVADFRHGRRRTMISKGKILGFGLNLQVATRMVFSGLQDSYETYWQCVKRANRVGSSIDLNVHIPITPVEAPMVDTVLKKAKRIQEDTEAQESMFKEACHVAW